MLIRQKRRRDLCPNLPKTKFLSSKPQMPTLFVPCFIARLIITNWTSPSTRLSLCYNFIDYKLYYIVYKGRVHFSVEIFPWVEKLPMYTFPWVEKRPMYMFPWVEKWHMYIFPIVRRMTDIDRGEEQRRLKLYSPF